VASANLERVRSLDQIDRRNAPREPIGRVAILREGCHPLEVRLYDLTREGCRIDTERPLVQDSMIRLGIAGIGQVDAQVLWGSEHGYGCKFAIPLRQGAVTAALSCNVANLPIASAIELRGNGVDKWSRVARTLFLMAYIVVPWAAIGGVAYLILV
jgi:hypothetical protein